MLVTELFIGIIHNFDYHVGRLHYAAIRYSVYIPNPRRSIYVSAVILMSC